MKDNINTKKYWDDRFSSNDWENNRGRWQTQCFAKSQLEYFELNPNIKGPILDFGCGLGDAIPIYKEKFNNAEFIGIDISESAISKCREKYGEIAKFYQGSLKDVPKVEVIIASNVLEHISNDIEVAKGLLMRCKYLYIIVPYNEYPLSSEHVNQYKENYFNELGDYDFNIFECEGWTQYGIKDLWYNVYIKNLFRPFVGRKICSRAKQIIFKFQNN